MARISLDSIVDSKFLNRFVGLASGQSGSVSSALRGGGDAVSIADGLRTGARLFSTSVQALNSVISVVGLTRSTLEELDGITDKLITVAKRASLSQTGAQTRNELDREYRRLGVEFRSIVDNADIGETEYLTVEGLSTLFTNVGLDKETSDSIADLFAQFVTPSADDVLASEEVQGSRPVIIPATAFSGSVRTLTQEFESLFSSDANIKNRPNAYRILNDLTALKKQIAGNIAAADEALDIVGKNLELARQTGLAFLDLADRITSEEDATEVARSLRLEIRRNAGQALSQAENLEPLIVAALAFDDSIKLDSKE